MRGETPLKVNVLSYDPINKDEIASILAGQNMNSRVANENYKDAKCETVLHTILKANYEKLWATIDNHYKEATKASYNLYSHNCGHVAKQALENADLAFPFFNINNQELSAPIKRVLQGQTDWSQPNEAIEASAALIGTAANMFTQNQSGEANKNCNIQ